MSSSEPDSGEVFDVDRILRLVELMKQHDLSEIDLRHSDQRIRLRRGGDPEPPRYLAQPAMSMMPAAASPPAAHAAPPTTAAPASDTANIYTMKSPMVGTFYIKPNPNSANFVKAGDRVQKDTTVVCIIEAMKVFNEIPSEVSGEVVAVLVDNEEPVEFGKPMFKIDTSK
jgi:acetyl-CoA carboxylase biotin carboxyl carrier protein